MPRNQSRTLNVLAPAKVNLFLHVTGRLENGYHTLDSLVSFVDIGDHIQIEPSTDFSFRINGSYASAFSAAEYDASPNSPNLAVQAAWELARVTHKTPQFRITLTKNLPLASGLGGGSSDAASVLWALSEWWGLRLQDSVLSPLAISLGADVPACLSCQPIRMQGIGEIISSAPSMKDTAIVLAHPGKRCPTSKIFSTYRGPYKDDIADLPDDLSDFDDLISFLAEQDNDLTAAAVEHAPDIAFVLDVLSHQKGCRLARMSGSGACCFGLFASEHEANTAAENMSLKHPSWWIRAGSLNRPERY